MLIGPQERQFSEEEHRREQLSSSSYTYLSAINSLKRCGFFEQMTPEKYVHFIFYNLEHVQFLLLSSFGFATFFGVFGF